MEASQKAKKIGLLGIIANFVLLSIKFIVGFMFKSQGLMADAINSFGDVFSSIATYVGGKISSKPEDTEHEFGHGKAEYVASFLIGIFMSIVSVDMIYNAVSSLLLNTTFEKSYILLFVPIITIVIKFCMYVYVNKQARNTNSLLIKANALDHRNDCLISLGVLIGIVSGFFGLYYIDAIVGIIISVIIIITGVKIIHSSYQVLIDKCVDAGTVNDIREYIQSIDGVEHIDSIKSKPTGSMHMFVIKISVNGDMTVSESHKIAGVIRHEITKKENVYDVVVHINPA